MGHYTCGLAPRRGVVFTPGEHMRAKRLYHFTALAHLGSILNEGQIRVTESNCSRYVTHAGPDVVWLTDDPVAEHHGWTKGCPVNKTAARITVDFPWEEPEPWRAFAQRHRVPRDVRTALASAGDDRRWWVLERPISRREWVAVEVWTGTRFQPLKGAASA